MTRYFDELRSASFTCKGTINNDALEQIVKPQDPYKIIFNSYTVNKRKHHKTRISKKWAKKYGTITYQDVYNVKEMRPANIGGIESYDLTLEFVRTEVI